jgi:hypothetical protein
MAIHLVGLRLQGHNLLRSSELCKLPELEVGRPSVPSVRSDRWWPLVPLAPMHHLGSTDHGSGPCWLQMPSDSSNLDHKGPARELARSIMA